MKFTDGFWLNRPGVELFCAGQVQEGRWEEDGYTVYCAHRILENRGMMVNAPMITLTFRAPREGVLAMKVEHYRGTFHDPRFPLNEAPAAMEVREEPACLRIRTGHMEAVIQKVPFRLDLYSNGRQLTGFGHRHGGYATTPGGTYCRVKLDVDIAEKIYGLGERFTPFVKNGQSVDIWNEDGGTSSEQAYKNIPFHLSSKGYGMLVNHRGRVSYEICSEAVESLQASVPGESMELIFFGSQDGTMAPVLKDYTDLTGKPGLPPAWSFGLWLTTSFTTDYREETILSFVDGMAARKIPLHVFHFDCFWMKGYEWCNFLWDTEMFPDPEGMLRKLHDRGLKVCVWINPYIGQKSPLFLEGKKHGYFLRRPNGDVWQWDMWQDGMAIVDFTNPAAVAWYQEKLKALLDMGVDCFKTDFGERIPTDCVYFNGSDPLLMHNYYTHLYNGAVYELLERHRGKGDACLFARSATAGGQMYPVHWGGDSTSTFLSMAESLRAGLTLGMCGFPFWSHDISGFEDTAPPEVYVRWSQFGLLSSHSRLHGSTTYRVPWLFGEDASRVLKQFVELKCALMPYLYGAAVEACQSGVPMMRAMAMAFPEDMTCRDLDLQYMLGDSLLVAPVFRKDGQVTYYLPQGVWTHLLTGETAQGGTWRRDTCPLDILPLWVRENTLLPMGGCRDQVVYDYAKGLTLQAYHPSESGCSCQLTDIHGQPTLTCRVCQVGDQAEVRVDQPHGEIVVQVTDHQGTRTFRLPADAGKARG